MNFFFQKPQEQLQTDHVISHQENFNIFFKLEMTQAIFCDNKAITLKIKQKKRTIKNLSM